MIIINELRDYFSTPIILKFIIAAGAFYIFDFITGYTYALRSKNVQSAKLKNGIVKFIYYVIFILIGVIADFIANKSVFCPLFSACLCSIELKSIDENFKKMNINVHKLFNSILTLFNKSESGYILLLKPKKKAGDLVKYAKAYLGHPYWYGCFGQISSKALYKSKKKQYPVQYQWECPSNQLNTRVFDCVGLIKGFLWSDNINSHPKYNAAQDVSANGMKEKCKTCGNISTLPEIPGALVFCPGHVGVYIGGGYVIEARGHKWGVVKTKLKERSFTSWGLCPWIDYSNAKKESSPEKNENKTEYYPKYSGSSESIVDALKSLKIDSSLKHRKKIAAANDFKSYSGTPKQNIKMLELLKKGKLKKE